MSSSARPVRPHTHVLELQTRAKCANTNRLRGRIGGLFLFGGVLMFFDRSLYVLPPHLYHWHQPINRKTHTNHLSRSRLAMGNVRHPPPSYLPTQLTQPPPFTDPLPNRPHADHRRPKDNSLLHPPPKTQRHRCLLSGHHPDPPAVAVDRLSDRVIRTVHSVWRLPRDDWPVCG